LRAPAPWGRAGRTSTCISRATGTRSGTWSPRFRTEATVCRPTATA
jgi:hypothetical protein